MTTPEDDQFNDLMHRVVRITLEFAEKINEVLDSENNITESNMLYATSAKRIAKDCSRIIVRNNMDESVYYYNIVSSLTNISEA